MNTERVLVFGAHPDDELRMAGTMAKLAAEGVQVHVAIMTNGNEGYPRPEMRDTIVALRRQEAADADRVLGIARRYSLDRDDMALTADKAAVPTLLLSGSLPPGSRRHRGPLRPFFRSIL